MDSTLEGLSELDLDLIENVSSAEMSPMQAMWARVNAEAAKLDPNAARIDDEIRKQNPKHRSGYMEVSRKVIWITSKKTPIKGIRGGRIFQAPPLLAASLIVAETHRLSTETEIASWEKDQGQRRELSAEQYAVSHPAPPTPQVHVNITPETLASLRGDTRRAQPQTPQERAQPQTPQEKQ
jgi:hypothetical protein